jgi:hypothetical protein
MIVHNPDHSSNEGMFLARAAAIRCFQELSLELLVNGRSSAVAETIDFGFLSNPNTWRGILLQNEHPFGMPGSKTGSIPILMSQSRAVEDVSQLANVIHHDAMQLLGKSST